MSDDFTDFSYGFIYECANLINNLYKYDHLAMSKINITKDYNKHVKNRYIGMYNYKI